jgi:hypothetical protein
VKKSTFTVIARRRRYLALSLLASHDQIPADLPVLCRVLDRDADAIEIGLAENVVRVAMHPADQFEAFRALVDKGLRYGGHRRPVRGARGDGREAAEAWPHLLCHPRRLPAGELLNVSFSIFHLARPPAANSATFSRLTVRSVMQLLR